MKATKPLSLESIDMESEEELDARTAQVLAAGDKIYEAQYQEVLRLGVLDKEGHLLKHKLPEDMREDADRLRRTFRLRTASCRELR